MSRDKQIEEMAKDLHSAYAINKLYTEDVANYLYNAGYRKATDIFEEIESKIATLEYKAKTPRKTVKVEELKAQVNWVLHEVVPNTIAELKKKYEILNSWEELTHTCQVEIPHSIESIVDIAFQESEGEG